MNDGLPLMIKYLLGNVISLWKATHDEEIWDVVRIPALIALTCIKVV